MLRMLFKKKNIPLKLGRWNTVIQQNDNNYIEKNIDWANHDHCGSEICEKYFDKYILKEKDIKNKDNDFKSKNKDEISNWTEHIKKKKSGNKK
tara:strand:+ start:298 stop:576 length:279 start_codon:yes stop_codon:yes gene_type:complete